MKRGTIGEDVILYSKVLNVLVSYYPRNVLLDDDGRDLVKFFTQWVEYEPRAVRANVTLLPSITPDFLLVGNLLSF